MRPIGEVMAPGAHSAGAITTKPAPIPGPAVHRLPIPRRLVVPVLALLMAAVTLGVLGPSRPAARGVGWSPVVEAPSSYDAQRTCTRGPRPGTVALSRWLLKRYPATRSLGLMRACGTGGTSEHKDGRAFDWGADVRNAAQRRAAYDFIRKALATDAAGNAHALARRMGIMYLIYNDTIWSAYRGFQPRPYLNPGCRSRATCSRSLRHLNHVHISLGLAGAAAQTSWYRARDIASQPVLHPGTNRLDPDLTAVTGFTVPATGSYAWSSFWVKPGVTYRLVVTGTVRYASGALGDANCTWPAGSTRYTPSPRGPLVDPAAGEPDGEPGDDWGWWQDREGSDHPPTPFASAVAETHGVLLRGLLRWEPETCRADHTYEAWYTPAVPERLGFRYADRTPADNAGTFTVYVARDDIVRSSLARR